MFLTRSRPFCLKLTEETHMIPKKQVFAYMGDQMIEQPQSSFCFSNHKRKNLSVSVMAII